MNPEPSSNSGHTGSIYIVWLIFMLGIITTAFGISYAAATHDASVADQVIAGLSLSAGSGMAGATISLIIAGVSDQDAMQKVCSVIASSLQSHFISDESDLQNIRKIWHHYHVTEVAGGYVWTYHRYRFDHSPALGSIVIEAPVRDSSGKEHPYRAEAGVRGSRLIMIDRRSTGSEQPAVHIYPHFAEGYHMFHCGVAFMVTWEGHSLVSRSLISQTKLIQDISEGIVPARYGSELNDIWEANFMSQDKLLPTP